MKWYLLFFLGIILFASCGEKKSKSSSKNQLELKELSKRVPAKLTIEFAENFHVRSVKGGYEVELFDPNSHEVEAVYQLTYDHSKKGEKVIHIPVQHIAALSQTTVGMLSKLDAIQHVSGISKIDYVYSPELKTRFKNGRLFEFGEETNLPIEKIVQSKSDLIVYSGFGKELDATGKLQKLGIASIPNYEWRENHPLGRAEWIKLIGILVDKSDKAETVFSEIKRSYQQLCWKIRSLKDTPKVISGNFYSDQWIAPAGNSYMAILMNDAGANYVYRSRKGTGSIFLPIEKVIADNQRTPYWIQPGIASKSALSEMNPKAQFIGAYKNGIYCYSHDMNRFWETSVIEPHLLLEDLIHIFHPDFEAGSSLHYYKRIAD